MPSSSRKPRYPIYIPTKGRTDAPYTVRMFQRDGVSFKVMVEPQEADAYAAVAGRDNVLVLSDNNRGLVFSRNSIKDHAIASGAARHWQFDDDIEYMSRYHKGYRIRCSSGAAIAAAEDFVDRYENVALASFNSEFFIACVRGTTRTHWPPFYLNTRCYTCFLMLNALPNRWRYRYNEDTDMTLQVLADGWCTVLFNAFMIKTKASNTNATGKGGKKGGGQAGVYAGDGRLQMAKQLQRVWPGVVSTTRRFDRPQHKVKGHWGKFDTKLIRRKDVDWDALAAGGSDEYGLKIKAVADVKCERLRKLVEEGNG